MINAFTEFDGIQYNNRHGGPFDRGTADSWYGRPREPHYFVGDTYQTTRLDQVDMSAKEVADYLAGYEYNEQCGGKKEWD